MAADATYISPYTLMCALLAEAPLVTNSYKMQPHGVNCNRYFIHLDEAARPVVKQELDKIAASLKMPADALAYLKEITENSDITFIGVDEDGDTCSYKIYAGFVAIVKPEAGKNAYSVEWTPGVDTYHVKEYAYEKEVTEEEAETQARQYLSSSTYEADPGGEMLYGLCLEIIGRTHFTSNFLSVKQKDAARRSVYFSLVEEEPVLFDDVRVVLMSMAALLDIPSGTMGWLNSLCKTDAVLEHIGIGVNSALQPFVTFYRNPLNAAPVYDTGEVAACCANGSCRTIQPSEQNDNQQTLNTIYMENLELQPNAETTSALSPQPENMMHVQPVTPSFAENPAITPSCSCSSGAPAAGGGATQIVFALGNLGYQFGNDSIKRSVEGELGPVVNNPEAFLQTLLTPEKEVGPNLHEANRLYYAESVLWTFNLDGFPIYAIRPEGAFAKETYYAIIRYLLYTIRVQNQVNPSGFTNSVRCTLAGTINGTVKLMNGMEVPVVTPDLRGMFCWTIEELLKELTGPVPSAKASASEKNQYQGVVAGVLNFMERVYFSLRNTGKTPGDRAMNYAVTNAFLVQKIFSISYQQQLALKSITAQKSAFGLPGADCWDVVLTFFNPMNQLGEANSIYTFTVDVSTTVPSLIGPLRSWKA